MSETRTGYRAVKEEILSRIRARRWPPGHAIPGELDLAEEFGVARGTVNRAMLELQEEGVIDRKRKAGTRVAVSPVRQAKLDIPLVRVEIESTGASYRYMRLSREIVEVPQWLRARLDIGETARMVHLRCLHLADNKPFQFEDRWIHIAAVPDAESESFEAINPNEWLVQAVPFTDVEFAFQAEPADADVAEMLGVKSSTAVFVAERTTWLSGMPVTFARMHFQPGYRMVSRTF
jgi:GntR family histidine utilization transcriptional repressor